MGSGGNPMGMYSRGKKDTNPYNMSTMEIGSLWESKTYIENPDSPLNCKYGGWDLSKKVLQVSVG